MHLRTQPVLSRFLLILTLMLVPVLAVAQQQQLNVGTAVASSQSGTSRSAGKAVDGDLATRWEASNSSAGSWLAQKFERIPYITSVQFVEYGDRVRGYEIQILSNGMWSTPHRGTTLPKGVIALQAINVSEVRVVFTARSAGQPSITEFKVFGELGPDACTPYDGTDATIIRGQVTCGGKTVALNCETERPLFKLADGATLADLNIGAAGSAGGIECQGSCVLRGINWNGYCNKAAYIADNAPAGARMLVLSGSARSLPAFVTAASKVPFWIPGNHNTLEIRYFHVYGELASLNNTPRVSGVPLWRSNRIFLINNLIHGTIPNSSPPDGQASRNGVVRILPQAGDVASIYSLGIANYQLGTPQVCNTFIQDMGVAVPVGEQWETAACPSPRSAVHSIAPAP